MIDEDQTGNAKSVSRRSFLAMATTGAVMSAGLLTDSHGKGRLPFIDCQSHLYSPEMIAFMKTRKSPPYAYEKDGQTYTVVGKWHRRLRKNHTDPKAKLAAMDRAGIEMTGLSINDPGPERFGKDGPEAARLANDFIASVVREYPGRFFGMALKDLK